MQIRGVLVKRTQSLQRLTWEGRRGKSLSRRRLLIALQAHHAIGDSKSHGKAAPSHQWTNPETWFPFDGRFNRLGLIHQENNSIVLFCQTFHCKTALKCTKESLKTNNHHRAIKRPSFSQNKPKKRLWIHQNSCCQSESNKATNLCYAKYDLRRVIGINTQ